MIEEMNALGAFFSFFEKKLKNRHAEINLWFISGACHSPNILVSQVLFWIRK
jgi:hypothetical protein